MATISIMNKPYPTFEHPPNSYSLPIKLLNNPKKNPISMNQNGIYISNIGVCCVTYVVIISRKKKKEEDHFRTLLPFKLCIMRLSFAGPVVSGNKLPIRLRKWSWRYCCSFLFVWDFIAGIRIDIETPSKQSLPYDAWLCHEIWIVYNFITKYNKNMNMRTFNL